MANLDPEKEKQGLSTLDTGMSDLELLKVGGSPETLTNWAFEALREEMKEPDLEWAGEDLPRPSRMVISAATAGEPAGRDPAIQGHA